VSKKLSALILKHKMLLVVAVALTTAVIMVSLPAFTASCSGSTCQGKDPNSTGCSSGAVNLQGPVYYVRNAGSTDLALSIRKNATCNARWVRLTIDSVDNNDGTGYTIKIQRQIYTPYGYKDNGVYTKRIYAFGTGKYWTAMVKNTNDDRVRMCMGVYTSTDSLGCQNWVP
jgi:hypothetical protein